MSPQEWFVAKQAVMALSANYQDVIKAAIAKDPALVDRCRDLNDKGTITTVHFGKFKGYELDMAVKDHDTKGVIEIKYFLFDNRRNFVFIRDILHPPELESEKLL